MAIWIAHLRLAENLLARIPNLDEAQFAIGNIAPDSGVPDEKWEHFDPPKEVTHFVRTPPPDVNCAQAAMDEFIEQATGRLYQAYRLLWPDPPELATKYSVLELLSKVPNGTDHPNR